MAAAVVVLAAADVRAADWIVSRSYYTHDPQSGERVNQYAPIGPFYIAPRSDYQESGFHHYQSSMNVGGSGDHYHVVREYGRAVRPYGEWQFPYRPYSVPYSQWGPPFGGLAPGAYPPNHHDPGPPAGFYGPAPIPGVQFHFFAPPAGAVPHPAPLTPTP